jgi:hypothetical protein
MMTRRRSSGVSEPGWFGALPDVWRSIRPIYPTPAEDLDAPF